MDKVDVYKYEILTYIFHNNNQSSENNLIRSIGIKFKEEDSKSIRNALSYLIDNYFINIRYSDHGYFYLTIQK